LKKTVIGFLLFMVAFYFTLGAESARRNQMKLTDNQQVLHHRGNVLVRRQRLTPGDATPWHRDPFHRVTVVLSGDLLSIEFRDGGETATWKVTVGEVDWVEPTDRVHRAVNVGKEPFEEVVTFFLDRPDAVPQPEADSQ
jgi:quercetin dioxygenase-like cupin family protein